MPLNVFLAFYSRGIDFMVYAFLQWTYGDRRSALACQTGPKNAREEQSHRPFLVHKSPFLVPKSDPTQSAGAAHAMLTTNASPSPQPRSFSDFGE